MPNKTWVVEWRLLVVEGDKKKEDAIGIKA